MNNSFGVSGRSKARSQEELPNTDYNYNSNSNSNSNFNKNNEDKIDKRLEFLFDILDLSDIISIIKSNKISFNDILYLSKEDLIELNINLCSRNRILKFIDSFKTFGEKYTIEELKYFFKANRHLIINQDYINNSNLLSNLENNYNFNSTPKNKTINNNQNNNNSSECNNNRIDKFFTTFQNVENDNEQEEININIGNNSSNNNNNYFGNNKNSTPNFSDRENRYSFNTNNTNINNTDKENNYKEKLTQNSNTNTNTNTNSNYSNNLTNNSNISGKTKQDTKIEDLVRNYNNTTTNTNSNNNSNTTKNNLKESLSPNQKLDNNNLFQSLPTKIGNSKIKNENEIVMKNLNDAPVYEHKLSLPNSTKYSVIRGKRSFINFNKEFLEVNEQVYTNYINTIY